MRSFPSFAVLLLVAGVAHAQVSERPATLSVETTYGFGTFLVNDLDANQSTASRLNDDRAEKNGFVPAPSAGYTLTGRVVVQTLDEGLLVDMVRSIDERCHIEQLPVAGYWSVVAPSVNLGAQMTAALEPVFGYGHVQLDVQQPSDHRLPTDPLFGNQWHLRNTSKPDADANVEDAWNAGYTGVGVIVGVIDGGSEATHEDLAANFNVTASKSGGSSSHGTAVAGVIAAVEGNNKGGVGAAYDSQWSRLYYGSSSYTADNFLHRNDLNDIKNNSWGPYDDGTIWTISNIEKNALEDSCTTGRSGLGEIFTWAAGNGGTGDRCDYDPYASSRFTVAVGAVGDLDTRSYYNESGSSMLVVAHSNGNNRGITTTDSGNSYTSSFGGTSSASPLGAGVIALMLDANPNLTWRDVQHVLVHSSRLVDPSHSNWQINGAGHDINYSYGFGCADAGAATALAASWTNVSAEQIFNSGKLTVNQTIPDNDVNGLEYTISVPESFYVEHAELILNVSHTYIGDLKIWIESPDGTRSLFTKKRNDSKNNLVNYIFTSCRSWDELSDGDWLVHVSDESSGTSGTLTDYKLKLYGNDGSHLGVGGFRVAASNLSSGATATLDVYDANPSATTWLAYSITGLGSFTVPPLGIVMDIANPVQIGTPMTSDASGHATWTSAVPGGTAGVPVWFQAVQMNNKSSVLSTTIN
ncbi:MAG: S8 family serine peptidase [Planctomycetes bacterium]|nr:S8 family serine peptidase [Planctomycetota bacterium]